MANDTRTPEEIEREIKRERDGLTDTLENLQDKFSVETVARQFTDHLRENGGDISRSVSRSVKDNPMAVALTGIGLAWMIFGGGSGHGRGEGYRGDGLGHRENGGDRDYSYRRPTGEFYDRRERMTRDEPSWVRDAARDAGMVPRSVPQSTGISEADHDSSDNRAPVSRLKNTAKSVSDKASATARSARSRASGAADQVSQAATDLSERLAEGTENFSEEARHRIVAARRHAVETRDAAMSQMRQGQERAVDLFEGQPLVAGAIALAAGAAVAAALPRSRMEDDYLGEQSDAAMAEAERIYQEEKAKLGKVAKAAGEEARKAARDLRAESGDDGSGRGKPPAVKKAVKSTAKRVASAAKSEAEKQNLGKTKS